VTAKSVNTATRAVVAVLLSTNAQPRLATARPPSQVANNVPNGLAGSAKVVARNLLLRRQRVPANLIDKFYKHANTEQFGTVGDGRLR